MRWGNQPQFKGAYAGLLILFIVICIITLKSPAGQALNIAMAPLLHIMQAPVRWYQEFGLWFEQSKDLQNRLTIITEKYVQQQPLMMEMAALRVENESLKQLLQFKQLDDYVWRAARVISRGQEQKSRRLMLHIEASSEDDVVVSNEGLVGLVVRSELNHAVVRTILDASLAVPVTMSNKPLSGLVRGDGNHLLVDFIPIAKAPQIGDVLITSGAGGLFPAGLPVAIVQEVNVIEGGVFSEIIADPISHWQRDAWLAVAGRKVDLSQ